MTDIKGTDTQPAAAQADSLITEMRNFADVADSCQITDGNAVAAIRSWADRLAASTPAAPGIDLEQFRPAVCAMGLYAVEPADVDEAKRLLRLIDDSLNGGNCCTCEGSGMIGGLLPAGGGYETEPCPDCSPKGGSDAPAGVLDALRSAEGLAMCCIAVDGYSRREIEEMARATAPRFTAAIKNMQATSAEVGA